MPDEFVDPNDLDEIVRPERKIAADPQGATPNEVARGLAEPTNVSPDPDAPSPLIDPETREPAPE